MSGMKDPFDKGKRGPNPSTFAGMGCRAATGDGRGPCGEMNAMMRKSPCATWFARHRLAAYTALTLFGLGLLLVPTGWLLGVIAFFRTI
jgi:hypothetical protein